MQGLPTPGVTTTSALPPSRTLAPTRRRCRRGWVGHAVRPVGITAVMTATIALTAGINRPVVAPAWADGVGLAPGVSVTPAPGWTVGDQGPGWVTLHNAFATAEMEIKVKPVRRTDPVALLQGDINNLSNASTTGLTKVSNLSAPTSQPVQGRNFQQEATIDYSADGISRMGSTPVLGWFMELLNPSTHQSAFLAYAQNEDAPNRADGEAGAIIDSML